MPGKLTYDQSWSFRRAVYQCWRLCRVFIEPDSSDEEDEDEDEDEDGVDGGVVGEVDGL